LRRPLERPYQVPASGLPVSWVILNVLPPPPGACIHSISTGLSGPYRHHLPSLPKPVGFELCSVAGVCVLIDVIELVRRGCGTQLRHDGSVLRFVLLAEVGGYRDGGEYSDDNDLPYCCQTTNTGDLRFRAMLTENGTCRVELIRAYK